MRSEQLEYVTAIARLGSFRRAAEELHISQPALSATVRNLERELGVDLLERGRTGAHVSQRGRELLPHIASVIDAVDQLRRAASDEDPTTRVVRIGTVQSATVWLLTSAAARFRELHPLTQVEVVGAQHAAIQASLRDGSLDLGLITCLESDDMPLDLETVEVIKGRAVVCLNANSPLAALERVGIDDLLTEPIVMMRAGYLMHRYVHRLLAGRSPDVSYTTDGADMGKLLVAEGLGATVLPDFSVIGDPLVRRGAITWRPLEDETEVRLVIQRRRSDHHSRAATDLYELLVEQAESYRSEHAADLRAA